jgi:hypothetical protein
MLLSLHQNSEKIYAIKLANRSFENASQLKYLGMAITNKCSFMRKLRKD